MATAFRCVPSRSPIHTVNITLSLAAALTSGAFAQTLVTWDGSESSDWTNPENWEGGVVPTKDPGNQHANISWPTATPAPNHPIITADIGPAPVDIFVGRGAGNSGRLDHTGGTAATGGSNWMFVGHSGGTGVYNLADTSVTGQPNLTGFGTGNGTMNVGGRLYIGGFDGAATGTLNVNTTGTLDIPDHFVMGNDGGTGTANLDAGTLAVGGETWVGQGGGATGVLNIGGGAITNNNWVAIGREGGTGTVNMTGGTWTKAGGNDTRFIIGANGTGGSGTLNQDGGSVVVQTGITWVGENQAGTHNFDGGTFTTTEYRLGVNTAGTGTANLNGGTLNTGWIVGGNGTANVNFNGTQIVATASRGDFIAGLDSATIGDGDLLINAQTFNLATAQNLSGTGGLVLSGTTGVLALAGTNTYTGGTQILGGTLIAGHTGALPGWNTPGLNVPAGGGLGARLGGSGFNDADFATLLSSANFNAGSSVGIDTTNGTYTLTQDLGTMTNAGTGVGLVKTGGNNLVVDLGTQTFTGAIVTRQGRLVLSHNSDVGFDGSISGNGGLTIEGTGQTQLNAGANVNINNEIWIAQGTGSSGTVVVNNGANLAANNWMAVGRASGSGELIVNEGGTVTKTGGGNLVVGSGGGGMGEITQNGGLVDLQSGNTYLGENVELAGGTGGDGTGIYTLNGGTANLGQLRMGHNNATNATFNLNGGQLNVSSIVSGSTGTRVFNFDGGVLRPTGSSETFMDMGEGSTANVLEGGAFIDTNGHDVTIGQGLVHGGSDPIDGGLTKQGDGTLTLNGTNTYTGATTVSAGTLLVNGSLGSGDLIVSSGATVGGTGTFGGGIVVSGTLAPGNSIGTTTVVGSLTFAAGSSFSVELDPSLGTADRVNIGGDLNIDPSAQLALALFGSDEALAFGTKFILADYEGSWNGTAFDGLADGSAFTFGANLYEIDYDDTTADGLTGTGLTLTVIPEPSAALLAALGAIGLLRRRR